MTVDPRAALDRLIAALEAHFNAVASRRGEDDPGVDDAYDVLADAFEAYDDALGTVYSEATPFYLAEEDDDEDDESDGGEAEESDDEDDEYDDDVLVDELTTEDR
ncbi:MAG: primosomal protein [Cellulomonas sp.]|uniref:primosomal protein n=1 Tax=Cellulomonas sp. TaxID=40001 RepID=UPI00180A7282|nr:primosomal protein [Cellulomonas sp.]NMM17556.1 primosomal protein [Cellulomonas sp.]NMM30522.1 primosomal protein [Cellulomonas sp.]